MIEVIVITIIIFYNSEKIKYAVIKNKMRSFNWVIARGIMLIIFVPIAMAWTDFFRDYVGFIIEECQPKKCNVIPVQRKLLYLILITILGFFIMYLLYKSTPILDF